MVRETREKLLYQIDEELQESVIAHWREGRDGFYYGRFVLANVIDRWNRGDDDFGLHKTGAHPAESKPIAAGFARRLRPTPLPKTRAIESTVHLCEVSLRHGIDHSGVFLLRTKRMEHFWILNPPVIPTQLRDLVSPVCAFRHKKPAVGERPLVEFKHAKHVISIRRYSSRASNALSPEEVHESALNNMLHLYSLTRASITVTNFDIHVSARQAMTIPSVPYISAWDPVTKALGAIKSGEGVMHGCDGLSTDIWSMRRLHAYHKSIWIYLIIKESHKKLLDGLGTELSERIISHWREGTDGFYYWKFRLADIIDCWSKDEGDLTYDDLLATHLISLWEEAFTQRLGLCKAIIEIRGSSNILLRGRNLLFKP